MKKDLKSTGYVYAGLRTFVLGIVIWFFLYATIVFWDEGLGHIITYGTIALISLIAIVYNWIYALIGGPFRDIKRFCNQSNNPEETMQKLESVWNDNRVTISCRADDEYFIIARKMRAVVIPLNELYGIRYVPGFAWFAGDLWIYLNDNTTIKFKINENQARLIEEHISKNVQGVAVGDAAVSRLLRTLIGKINSRYQIIKIRERFFIIDFANPNKLSSYLSLGEKYRFSESGTKRYLRAWEISREELQNIKSGSYKVSSKSVNIIGGITIGGAVLATFFLINHPISDALSIRYLFGGQFWILALVLASIFLACFLFTSISTKFETKNYPEVRISRKKASYTKKELVLYIVARLSALMVMLFFIVMMFVWNVGTLPYAILVFVLVVYVFLGAWAGNPTIDPKSTVSVLYKKVKSKEKRRIVKLRKMV